MKIKVLLVDDHRLVREGLRSLLSTYRQIEVVGEAADGRKAIREVERLKPHIVLMDIAMTEMNGLEATRKITENFRSCRIIILSMHATSEYIYQSFKAGAKGYLLKESAGQEVVEAIKTVARGGKYLSRRLPDTLAAEWSRPRRANKPAGPLQSLSPREREILQLVVEGKSSSEIAGILFLSSKTVETYRSRLMKKLEVHNVPALVKFAIKHGLTSL